MKKLFLSILLLSTIWSCKKEDVLPPTTTTTHNIKYEALGQCCYMEVTYDGTTVILTSQFNWDYSFAAPSGQLLSLSAWSKIGAIYQTMKVNIYIDGIINKTAQGASVQSITSTVP